MKIGFIGAGSMGSLLVEAFVDAGAMRPETITVASRTPAKAEALARRCPGVRLAASNAEAASGAELLFLCVKPSDYRNVLADIAPIVQAHQIVISITSPVLLADLERILPCKVAKIIPSITHAVRSGAALCMWGARLEPDDREKLTKLLASISRPVEIQEDHVRAASDLTSCGPAFFAQLLEQFTEAVVGRSGMNRDTAAILAAEMLLGTGRLLTEGELSTQTLQARVSVPGGITAAGLESLKTSTAGAFTALLGVTHDKFAEDLAKVGSLLRPDPS